MSHLCLFLFSNMIHSVICQILALCLYFRIIVDTYGQKSQSVHFELGLLISVQVLKPVNVRLGFALLLLCNVFKSHGAIMLISLILFVSHSTVILLPGK